MTATLAPPAPRSGEERAVALGRRVRLVAVGGDPLPRARELLDRCDRLWSTDARSGDLTRIARRPGTMVAVAPETLHLVALAAAAAGPDAAGRVLVDERHGRVGVDPAAGLDLPQLARALTADLLVESMLAGGARGALASVGDSVRAGGVAADPAGWMLPASGPAGPGLLEAGGIASRRSAAGTVVVVADRSSRAAALALAVDPAHLGDADRLLTEAGAVGRVWTDGRLVPLGAGTRWGAGVRASLHRSAR
jgi:hypothetical protein